MALISLKSFLLCVCSISSLASLSTTQKYIRQVPGHDVSLWNCSHNNAVNCMKHFQSWLRLNSEHTAEPWNTSKNEGSKVQKPAENGELKTWWNRAKKRDTGSEIGLVKTGGSGITQSKKKKVTEELKIKVPKDEEVVPYKNPEQFINVPAQNKILQIKVPEKEVIIPAKTDQIDVDIPEHAVEVPKKVKLIKLVTPAHTVTIPAKRTKINVTIAAKKVIVPGKVHKIQVIMPGGKLVLPEEKNWIKLLRDAQIYKYKGLLDVSAFTEARAEMEGKLGTPIAKHTAVDDSTGIIVKPLNPSNGDSSPMSNVALQYISPLKKEANLRARMYVEDLEESDNGPFSVVPLSSKRDSRSHSGGTGWNVETGRSLRMRSGTAVQSKEDEYGKPEEAKPKSAWGGTEKKGRSRADVEGNEWYFQKSEEPSRESASGETESGKGTVTGVLNQKWYSRESGDSQGSDRRGKVVDSEKDVWNVDWDSGKSEEASERSASEGAESESESGIGRWNWDWDSGKSGTRVRSDLTGKVLSAKGVWDTRKEPNRRQRNLEKINKGSNLNFREDRKSKTSQNGKKEDKFGSYKNIRNSALLKRSQTLSEKGNNRYDETKRNIPLSRLSKRDLYANGRTLEKSKYHPSPFRPKLSMAKLILLKYKRPTYRDGKAKIGNVKAEHQRSRRAADPFDEEMSTGAEWQFEDDETVMAIIRNIRSISNTEGTDSYSPNEM